MQTKFILTDSLPIAAERCPWASVIVAVEGGYLAFESPDDYYTWLAQA